MSDARPPVEKPPKTPRRSTTRLIPARFDWATGWIQAFVAILTLTLGVITAWGLLGTRNDPPAPTVPSGASPSAVALKPVLTLSGTDPAAEGLLIHGEFLNVNLVNQGIFMVGRPPGDTSTRFTILEAETTPLRTFPIDLADGEWQVLQPEEYAGFAFDLLVYSGAFGSGDVLKDLREQGPDAADVEVVIEIPAAGD